MIETILKRVKIRLEDVTVASDELLEELVVTAVDRICLKVGENRLDDRLISIAVDVTVKLYRRIYFEGINSEKADTITTSFVNNVLAEYDAELAEYKSNLSNNKRVVRFI